MEMVSGVYCIENTVNHKKYIGQSVDIYRRWGDHKRELNSQRHHNIYLQRAWNKYGADNFQFYILEQCEVKDIDKIEIYYIQTFHCTDINYGYNIESGGNSNKKMADETCRKISESRKGKYCGGDNSKAHSVYCPQLDRVFSCLKEIDDEGIACSAGVRDCLRGRSKTAGRHPVTNERLTWYDADNMNNPEIKNIIEDEKNKISHVSQDIRIVPVYCPELNRVFSGGALQVEKEGVAIRTGVSSCLSGKRQTSGKHPVTGEPLHWIRFDAKENNSMVFN